MQPRITKVSDNCLDIIRHFEELRLSAYLCPAGVWTIGYGTTRYPDGSRVKQGDKITRENANKLLLGRVAQYERQVDDLTRDDITQQQFDALVSITYNIGTEGYRTSSLRREVNSRTADAERINYRFGQWKKATVDGKLITLDGLVRRRRCEATLYNTGEVHFYLPEPI